MEREREKQREGKRNTKTNKRHKKNMTTIRLFRRRFLSKSLQLYIIVICLCRVSGCMHVSNEKVFLSVLFFIFWPQERTELPLSIILCIQNVYNVAKIHWTLFLFIYLHKKKKKIFYLFFISVLVFLSFSPFEQAVWPREKK